VESGFTELTPEEIKALESVNEQTVAAEQEAVAQQQAAAQPAPQAPTPEVTQPVLEGLGKWMEENVNIPIVDMLDGSRNAEEVAADRAEMRQEAAELQQEVDSTTSITGEIGTALIGGAADVVETLGETAELYGDTQRALFARPIEAIGGSIDQKEVPWSESYEWAEWDLGVAENKTAVGSAARSIFSTLIGMKGLRTAGVGIGGGESVASRLGSEALRGAIYDFFVDPGEGNLSNLIQAGPLANPLSQALAQDEDDNQWIRRAKNMLEGGTIGIAVDGLTELYGALRAGGKARKAALAKGASKEEAAEAGTKAAIREAENAKVDLTGKDPGSAQRKMESDLNSGRPDGSVERLYEPNERAAKTTKYDFEDAASTQATRSTDPEMPGGSKPTLNEQDFMNFTDVDRLRDYIAETAPNVDLARVAKSLSLQENEYTLRAYQSIADFVTNGNMETLENLRYMDSMNFKGARADGVVVIDVLARDTAEQMLDLATSVIDVNSVNGDVAQQGIQLMRRAEALAKMQKEVSTQGAFNLMDFWKKEAVPQQKASLERSLREIENRFTGIREAFENGTNDEVFKASSELADLSRGMIFSGGDPTAITSFWGAIAKVGMRDINTAVINAWLSSPLSQVRNLAGNAFTASMRPLTLSVGKALGGDFTGARQALTMYDSIFSTMGEGLSVARKSLSRNAPITEGSKLVDYSADTLKEVEALKKTASTNPERYAANMMGWYHSWANSPWVTWPGKGLQAGDDMFKTMVARMDLRYQAAVEADKLAKSAAEEGASARIPGKDEIYKKLLNLQQTKRALFYPL